MPPVASVLNALLKLRPAAPAWKVPPARVTVPVPTEQDAVSLRFRGALFREAHLWHVRFVVLQFLLDLVAGLSVVFHDLFQFLARRFFALKHCVNFFESFRLPFNGRPFLWRFLRIRFLVLRHQIAFDVQTESGRRQNASDSPAPCERIFTAAMAILDLVLGRPLSSAEDKKERLGSFAGVSVFGLDALSSAAYGPEAALTILIPLGAAGLQFSLPITIAVSSILAIVFFSYRQTIAAYPNGAGTYIVAKENLGRHLGLLGAVSLLIDYTLNVAVGISAGIGEEWDRRVRGSIESSRSARA